MENVRVSGAALPGLRSLLSVGLFCPLMAAESRPTVWNNSSHFWGFSFTLTSLTRPTGECISCTKVTPCTEQTARRDRQCNSPHMALKHSNYILQSLMLVLCTAIVVLELEFFPLLWIPFHRLISNSRSSIRNQCCRNVTIISDYWKIRTLKINSWLTQALSLYQKYWQSQDFTRGSVTVLDAFL